LFLTLRSDYQTEYSDTTGHIETFVDINKELNELKLLDEKDLDQSSSLMSLFIPHNATDDRNVTKNDDTKKSKLTLKSNNEDLKETSEPKMIDTKMNQNRSLSFEDLFTYLFEK
jgi:hypothetical protein